MEETKVRRFKESIGQDYIDKRIRFHPFEVFEKWPIAEIRVKCLATLRTWDEFNEYHAELLEECITDLFEQRDKLYRDLLDLYIFKTKRDLAARAIEFALSLNKKSTCGTDDLSKWVAGRLIKDSWGDIYSKVPSLRGYLTGLLGELEKYKADGYPDYYWFRAERAIRVILRADDFSFLPQIEKLLLLHQQKVIGPDKYHPHYQRDVNMAILRATVRELGRAKKEHILEANKDSK